MLYHSPRDPTIRADSKVETEYVVGQEQNNLEVRSQGTRRCLKNLEGYRKSPGGLQCC